FPSFASVAAPANLVLNSTPNWSWHNKFPEFVSNFITLFKLSTCWVECVLAEKLRLHSKAVL
ncbi:32216_t:CDS:2, partial [Racocetra persica]